MSIRLPIYRSLTQYVEILGLSLWEIAFLIFIFLFFTEVLRSVPQHTLIGFGVVLSLGAALRHFNRRYEKHFLARLVRFIALPDRLTRHIYQRPNFETKHVGEKQLNVH